MKLRLGLRCFFNGGAVVIRIGCKYKVAIRVEERGLNDEKKGSSSVGSPKRIRLLCVCVYIYTGMNEYIYIYI